MSVSKKALTRSTGHNGTYNFNDGECISMQNYILLSYFSKCSPFEKGICSERRLYSMQLRNADVSNINLIYFTQVYILKLMYLILVTWVMTVRYLMLTMFLNFPCFFSTHTTVSLWIYSHAYKLSDI